MKRTGRELSDRRVRSTGRIQAEVPRVDRRAEEASGDNEQTKWAGREVVIHDSQSPGSLAQGRLREQHQCGGPERRRLGAPDERWEGRKHKRKREVGGGW